MWYERDYGVNFMAAFGKCGKLFDSTFDAIFNNGDTNLFEVLLVGILVAYAAGFLLYLLRQNRR